MFNKKRKDDAIDLTKEQKSKSISLLKEYMKEEFELDSGDLRAGMFLDFITENIGVFYYNKALADSMTFINQRVEDMYLLMKDEVK